MGAESASTGAAAHGQTDAFSESGFNSPRSVQGTLAATAEAQETGALEEFRAWKKRLDARTGLTFGVDNMTLYLGTNSNRSPSDAASNVFRLYGTWTTVGRGTPDEGALVFKIENRSAIGGHIPPRRSGRRWAMPACSPPPTATKARSCRTSTGTRSLPKDAGGS